MWHDMFEDKDRTFSDGFVDGMFGVPNVHPGDPDYTIGHLVGSDDDHDTSHRRSTSSTSDGGMNIGAIIFGMMIAMIAVTTGWSIAHGEPTIFVETPIHPAFGWLGFASGVIMSIGFIWMFVRRIINSLK